MLDGDLAKRIGDPAGSAKALAAGLRTLDRPPVIGIVHRFSSHALMLRYWLGHAGIDPDRDVTLRVLPPSLMTEALQSGAIDGFSAGEPWNSVAVAAGAGELAAFDLVLRGEHTGVAPVGELSVETEAVDDLVDRGRALDRQLVGQRSERVIFGGGQPDHVDHHRADIVVRSGGTGRCDDGVGIAPAGPRLPSSTAIALSPSTPTPGRSCRPRAASD